MIFNVDLWFVYSVSYFSLFLFFLGYVCSQYSLFLLFPKNSLINFQAQSNVINLMSLFLTPEEYLAIRSLPEVLEHIHILMRCDYNAIPLKTARNIIYRTTIPMSQSAMEIYWTFEIGKDNDLKLTIKPNFSDSMGGNFRIQSQRRFVDLLKMINNLNRTEKKQFVFKISQFNFVEMCTIFKADLIKDYRKIKRLIDLTIQKLPAVIKRLYQVLEPFMQDYHQRKQLIPPKQGYSLTKKFQDKSMSFIYWMKFNQIKNRDSFKRIKEQSVPSSDKQIEKEIDQQKNEALQYLKNCFKILHLSDSILKQKVSFQTKNMMQWFKSRRRITQKHTEDKNVYGIKIIKEESKNLNRENEGSHCQILYSTFKLILLLSIHKKVNTQLQQIRKQSTKKQQLIPMRVEKQLDLVKKIVKNPSKIQSKNSFLNELDFIVYIKQRCCKYVSTYYWEQDKKKEQMETIIMDYYPHNLRQMLVSHGKYMSYREKLAVIQKITEGINWLSDNYVCHRDIKPDNIMMNEKKVPKIVDFGSCCPVNGRQNTYFQVKQTRLLGTPSYYFPFDKESSLSKSYMKYQYERHMLFDAYSLGKLMEDVFSQGLPDILPNLESVMNYIIERCKQPDPADRITYEEMLFFFDQIRQGLERLQSGNS